MQIDITKNVDNHRVNPEYPVVRVRWSAVDLNFRIDDEGPNWCPRDEEALDLVFNLLLMSPTFYEKLVELVRVLEEVRR